MKKKKDYCTCFPESIVGIDISDCCKKHDNEVGMRGTYNPITPHVNFYNCLRNCGLPKCTSFLITIGGTLFTWVKQPYL